ncbi:PASTA domain-containing protein [Paenibacillus sp. EKM202P]|uniref:penicillin-binding transpeptidase domain-containing protein n=1 Tax=unclassified Paenibacillus TaxID=185978 RepID=UPI0013EAC659|nr:MULTISPECIES: penicillin-binding transpeptidase domain-containing protein [unclassified Paenibacillus]KAF6568372.1 PASTA domain-containing protein [Paenibacillus sp. EKM202P]KAF6570772.1 PASTA domain-containing protein [Paenibacillus sp. EKM207P]
MVKRIKLRTLLIGGCITLFFLVLLLKVFWIQVVSGEYWHNQVVTQIERDQVIQPKRGTIMDRKGNVLATDAPAYTVVVNPSIIQEYDLENEVVAKLHQLLKTPEDELRRHLSAKDKEGNYLKNREIRNGGWKVDPEVKTQVDTFKEYLKDKYEVVGAVDTVQESKRYYPENKLASHILGYQRKDGTAGMGLEAYYNKELSGTAGKLLYQRDRKGVPLQGSESVYEPAQNGKNLKLTVDDTIQYYIEDAMQEAIAKYNPKTMTVVAADPKTMDVLGMATYPNFNPNTYGSTPLENFRNNATQSIYEPGSTFKIVTLAAAVQEKVFNPNETYQSGMIRVGGWDIRDVSRNWGTLTYLQGVKRSSNVGFVHLGLNKLGGERLKKYINNFGFGMKTGIDLPSESTGAITFHTQYKSEVATAAYGHGRVQVTPIQQVAAISAIANGGKLMQPHLVKEIINPDTGEVQTIQPKEVRRVITQESAAQTSSYLEQVVSDQEIGTGRLAYIDGYRVAGKTGTATKVVGKVYDHSKDVVSFIGFAPVNDPKIAVLVVMDEPNKSVGGGTAAAPVFKKIVSQSLQYMGVPKTGTKTNKSGEAAVKTVNLPTVPQLTGQVKKDAQNALLKQGIAYETVGKGSKIVRQYPEAGVKMKPGQRIYLLTEDSANMTIPDFTGVSLRDTLQVLTLMKVGVQVSGEGYVVSQKAQMVNGKRVVSVTLQPAKETVTGVKPEETQDSTTGVAVNETGNATKTEADTKTKTDTTADSETNAGTPKGGISAVADEKSAAAIKGEDN